MSIYMYAKHSGQCPVETYNNTMKLMIPQNRSVIEVKLHVLDSLTSPAMIRE